MSKRTTESIVKSSPERDELEGWLRVSMQKLIQEVLEDAGKYLGSHRIQLINNQARAARRTRPICSFVVGPAPAKTQECQLTAPGR